MPGVMMIGRRWQLHNINVVTHLFLLDYFGPVFSSDARNDVNQEVVSFVSVFFESLKNCFDVDLNLNQEELRRVH